MLHDELTERLDAFAAATLTPDAAAMSRIRAELVALAAQRDVQPLPASRPAAVLGPLVAAWAALRGAFAGPSRFRTVQRFAYVAGAFAIALSMAAGASAASRPGAPLYQPRLWLETVTLPNAGPERAAKELPLLDRRLDEIRDAVERGDRNALEAALSAYESTAADVESNSASDDQTAQTAIAKHIAVLEELLGKTGGKSEAAIRAAIERAIARLEAGKPSDNGPDNGNHGNGNQGNGNQGPAGSQGNGNQGAGGGQGNGNQGGGNQPTPGPGKSHGRPSDRPTPKAHDH